MAFPSRDHVTGQPEQIRRGAPPASGTAKVPPKTSGIVPTVVIQRRSGVYGDAVFFRRTEAVAVTDTRDRHTAAAVLGGGLKYYVSPRYGIRVDVRVSLTKNSASTLLDAQPLVEWIIDSFQSPR